MYKLSVKFNSDTLKKYGEVKQFYREYPEKMIKAYALPEKADDDKTTKEEELQKIEVELKEKSKEAITKDSYYLITFVDEVNLELNTYGTPDSTTKEKEQTDYIFDDKFAPFYVVTYLGKMYPNFLEYFEKFELKDDKDTSLFDFTKLKNPVDD